MSFAPDDRLGPYRIIEPVGAGGMGEVYRAHDDRLGRDVAIKVIPASLARDPDRVARFEREARAVAALSHPNILTVFDTGTHEGTVFVVMELLGGETLGERLRQGSIPTRKAIEIARLIAQGLSAAHEKGIVHRDLKPDNVFLTADGQVKILDFGLARPIGAPQAASETRAAITDAGTVMGTVGYMAPEQVRGRDVDARADLFALGAVLYEMLAGRRAFLRDTAAETMTAILHEDPAELTNERAPIAPALDRIVRHCLEKNPAERFQTARDVAFALDALSGSASLPAAAAVAVPPRPLARERLFWALATLALGGVVVWSTFLRPEPAAIPAQAYRATVLLPNQVTVADRIPGRRLAIAPDGSVIAFIGRSPAHPRALWVQRTDGLTATLVEGTENAVGPFFSADSRTLYFHQDGTVRKLDAGGRPIEAGDAPGGGAWGPGGQRVFVDPRTGSLQHVDPSGQQREIAAGASGGRGVLYPSFLPDGRGILYANQGPPGAKDSGFYIATTDGTTKRVTGFSPDSEQINAAAASGYFVSVRNGMIIARAIDPETLSIAQEAHTIGGPVDALPGGSAAVSVSETGVLVYQPVTTGDVTRLLWFNRDGSGVSELAGDADYSNLELSPDGTKLLTTVTDRTAGTRDIWVVDLARGVPTRMTFDPVDERSAVWSLDGTALIYRGAAGELFARPFGSGSATPFLVDKRSKDPRGWSPDGRFFVYRVSGGATGNDVWVKPADPAAEPYPFIATPFNEPYAEFSPDSKWLAYVSDESGQPEVYVTPFPAGGSKERVSTAGGEFPRWRGDSREIYYLSPDRKMMAAAVSATAPNFRVATARMLFQTDAVESPGSKYIVTPDGARFLVNTATPSNAPPSLHIVINWPALIGKR